LRAHLLYQPHPHQALDVLFARRLVEASREQHSVHLPPKPHEKVNRDPNDNSRLEDSDDPDLSIRIILLEL